MLLHVFLTRLIRTGHLTVRYPDGAERQYGGEPGPQGGLVLHDWAAARQLALDPGLAGGELFMAGRLDPLDGDLYAMIEVFMVNLGQGGHAAAGLLVDRARRLKRFLDQHNPAGRARRNVAVHYDLDAWLFRQFLDAEMQYSCAYFATGQETLDAAQAAKQRHIAAKLRLDRPKGEPPLEVLDIGCGWGGLAVYLARRHGARVTGLTLSTEQLAAARARAAAEGLEDRLRFELMDYRAWDRPVDRIVSVGMFEAVGLPHYRQFFRTVRTALKPDGVALIHSIGRAHGPEATNPWLAKYIFPGGYSPALSEVLPAVERSGLWVTDIEILRLHYAETLRHWRSRFTARREAIRARYDERLCRMFEFYLAGCEAAFRHAGHMVWQMQLARRPDAVPLTRDYIQAAEQAAAPA